MSSMRTTHLCTHAQAARLHILMPDSLSLFAVPVLACDLFRVLSNVNDFFRRQGVDIVGTRDLFDLVRDPELAAEAVAARIKQLQAAHEAHETGNQDEVCVCAHCPH
jgi:hypothetical protein